jgi:hypothetical protein
MVQATGHSAETSKHQAPPWNQENESGRIETLASALLKGLRCRDSAMWFLLHRLR